MMTGIHSVFAEEMKNECVDNREYSFTENEVIFLDFLLSINDPTICRVQLYNESIKIINKCNNIRFMELFCNVNCSMYDLTKERTFLIQSISQLKKEKKEKKELEKEKKELEKEKKEWSCEKIFCSWM
jgi:hypothetical protein